MASASLLLWYVPPSRTATVVRARSRKYTGMIRKTRRR